MGSGPKSCWSNSVPISCKRGLRPTEQNSARESKRIEITKFGITGDYRNLFLIVFNTNFILKTCDWQTRGWQDLPKNFFNLLFGAIVIWQLLATILFKWRPPHNLPSKGLKCIYFLIKHLKLLSFMFPFRHL